MKVKRILCLLLMISAILCLVAGCGEQSTDTGDDDRKSSVEIAENAAKDATNLRYIYAEVSAYFFSGDFVNTATADSPMEVPAEYYTDVKSASGDGALHVYMNVDDTIEAYFGNPDHNAEYYQNLANNVDTPSAIIPGFLPDSQKTQASTDAANLRAVISEVYVNYLYNPDYVTILSDGKVTDGFSPVECKTDSSWKLSVTYDESTDTFSATFGGHDIDYFDQLASE